MRKQREGKERGRRSKEETNKRDPEDARTKDITHEDDRQSSVIRSKRRSSHTKRTKKIPLVSFLPQYLSL